VPLRAISVRLLSWLISSGAIILGWAALA
jgi:hypothetical protein